MTPSELAEWIATKDLIWLADQQLINVTLNMEERGHVITALRAFDHSAHAGWAGQKPPPSQEGHAAGPACAAVTNLVRSIHAIVKRGEGTEDHGLMGNLHCILDALLSDPVRPLPDSWIAVSERLPPDDSGQLFVWDSEGRHISACTFPQGWHAGLNAHDYITHWMPGPSAPRKDAA